LRGEGRELNEEGRMQNEEKRKVEKRKAENGDVCGVSVASRKKDVQRPKSKGQSRNGSQGRSLHRRRTSDGSDFGFSTLNSQPTTG